MFSLSLVTTLKANGLQTANLWHNLYRDYILCYILTSHVAT